MNGGFCHECAPSLNPVTALCQGGMIGNKLTLWNTVSIEEHNIVTTGFRDCPVQDNGLPKVLVLLPAMSDRKAESEDAFLDQDPCWFS